MFLIETMEKCNRFLDKFRVNGWEVWRMQYYWDLPEGLHAWFRKTGETDIEVVTHNENVHKAILKFK